jgi:YD repeat-containing protein
MNIRYLLLVTGLLVTGGALAQQPSAAQIKAKKIKKITVLYSGDSGSIPETYVYYYDQFGNDTSLYMNGNRYSYKIISYDKNGRRVTEERFFASGDKMDKTDFTYKSDGSFTSINTDSQFGMKVTELYDKKGNQLSHTIPDGTVIKYTYNGKGQKASMYSIPIKGEKKFVVAYSYGSNGRMNSSTRSGDSISKSTYVYDNNGFLKKETILTQTESAEKHQSFVEYSYE